MNRPLVLLCSPHPNGVSDTVAALFAQGMADAGQQPRLLRGLETTQDLLERPAVCGALRSWGHDWGSRLAARQQAGAAADQTAPNTSRPDATHQAPLLPDATTGQTRPPFR